jgi:cytochrome c oxidase subunit 2
MARRFASRMGAVGLAVACAGCAANRQSALDTHGPQADSIGGLMLTFGVVCAAVWILVMLGLAGSLLRRRATLEAPATPSERSTRRSTIIVSALVGATVIIITALTLLSFFATRGLTAANPDALVIRLRSYQWWWEASYRDPRPDHVFAVANEMHVPVGQPVRILLEAPDVIHSFWVPSLSGKKDLIPGRNNEITITAERPGTYRGQCAQFCGLQHAHMAFFVIADTPADFAAWQNAQLQPSAGPSNPEEEAGRRVFLSKPCAACHTVAGTTAAGTLGPDLTHVGSRTTIAAGLLPTTRGSLAAWIADPQTIKPGNNMPMVALSGDELRAVSAYMSSLK